MENGQVDHRAKKVYIFWEIPKFYRDLKNSIKIKGFLQIPIEFLGDFHDFSRFLGFFRFWRISSTFSLQVQSLQCKRRAVTFVNFEDGKLIFIAKNKTFITHPVACEFSSCNSHKHKSYDDLKILSKKLTFFPGSGKNQGNLLLTWRLGVICRFRDPFSTTKCATFCELFERQNP